MRGKQTDRGRRAREKGEQEQGIIRRNKLQIKVARNEHEIGLRDQQDEEVRAT